MFSKLRNSRIFRVYGRVICYVFGLGLISALIYAPVDLIRNG